MVRNDFADEFSRELKNRIRGEEGKKVIMSAKEAAKFIKDGMVLGMSGFTPSDYPKLIPLELVERKKNGEPLKVDVYSGATLGIEVDTKMAEAGVIRKRLPFCNNPVIRSEINNGNIDFIDLHLSQSTQYVNYGFLPPIDIAVVEVLAITEDGDLIPSTAVGNTATFVERADSVLVEIAMNKPLALEGMHDIFHIENPPFRKPIEICSPSDRIGDNYIKCGWKKIKAVVISDQKDSPRDMVPVDDDSKQMSQNVIKFLENEVAKGRLTEELAPIQSGVGNVANAMLEGLKDSPFNNLTAYSEVFQDGMLELLRSGKMRFVSATCATLSPKGFEQFFHDIDFFRDKIILRPQEISNSPEVIRRLGVIAINTAIEIDIYGNVNSSHLQGKRIMNGIGGSGDYSRNAGISIFTTASTAKNGRISSIVPMCSHVDHTEHEVMVVVTEQGYADLRGLSPKERAVSIIQNCAHPDYRERLMDYFERACKQMPCQTPHILDEALSWHDKFEKTGKM